jgi:metal iron transporter
MASLPPTDNVDHVVTQSSPRASISNEKAGIAVVAETVVSPDAKSGVKAEVSQVYDSPSTSQMQSYMQSFRELFTVEAFRQYGAVLVKFGKFTGPGTIISIAYIDPDNYQTAVSSGTEFKFKLLFMMLVSNLIAIYLQVSIFTT